MRATKTETMVREACFDATGAYRYTLTRVWRPGGGRVAFVLLNPSTADATRDDPTIRRCIGFARAWGFGALEVVNLFAYRATHPPRLRACSHPVGCDNDRHLLAARARADLVVVAWGVHGGWQARDRAVTELLAGGSAPLQCLGLTKGGHPRHVLYLPAALHPRPFVPLA
jgi:hypothetical protein